MEPTLVRAGLGRAPARVYLDTPARRAAARKWSLRWRRHRLFSWARLAGLAATVVGLVTYLVSPDEGWALTVAAAGFVPHVVQHAREAVAASGAHPDLRATARASIVAAVTVSALVTSMLVSNPNRATAAAALLVAAVAVRDRLVWLPLTATAPEQIAVAAVTRADQERDGAVDVPAVLPVSAPLNEWKVAKQVKELRLSDETAQHLRYVADRGRELRVTGGALFVAAMAVVATVRAPHSTEHVAALTVLFVVSAANALQGWEAKRPLTAPGIAFSIAAASAVALAAAWQETALLLQSATTVVAAIIGLMLSGWLVVHGSDEVRDAARRRVDHGIR